MKRKNLFLAFMAFLIAIPLTSCAKKPKLSGTVWEYDRVVMMNDVGKVKEKESIIFSSKTEVTILKEEWIPTIMEGTPRELIDPATGKRTIIKGEKHRTSKMTKKDFKGTYTMKKVKVNGNKLYRVYITIDGKTEEYTIDGNLMIPATSSLSDQRVFKKKE